MTSIFTSKYIRLSPKKAEVFARTIKKMSPQRALETLLLTREKQAVLFSKIIEGAIADAVNNKKLSRDNLIFESIQVTKGPAFKRWNPVARGMAHPIKKRTSHIKIVLGQKKIEKPKEESIKKLIKR
ncbi:50S ribosomal protein L22 [Candidatus Gottesmanbacteria bacterium]|nr:50S ribosomal protein L22 [Candidatus Gottesmanbacteria bacterium]